MIIMKAYKIFIIGSFFMLISSHIEGNSDCNLVSTTKHQISPKDFKVTRLFKKYVMCAAYYCSHNPTVLPLELLVHEINSTKDNLAIHLDKRSIDSLNKCSQCQKRADFKSSERQDAKCEPCPEIEPSKVVEIHVRLDKSSVSNTSSNEECIWDINFNMSIQEYTCKDGVATNIPTDNHCNVSNLELTCIKPTCSVDMLTNAIAESFIYKFKPTNNAGICIWNVSVDLSETLDIEFSPSIKKHLIIFQEDLLKPRWDLQNCSNHTSHMKIETRSRNILILYKNMESLLSEAYLQVNVSKSKTACPLPATINNGKVDFHLTENGTVALYNCFENFSLIGMREVNCQNKDSQPPVCVKEKERFMSDSPKSAIESVHYTYPSPFQDNPSLSILPSQETLSPKPSHKTVLDQSKSRLPKGKLVSDEPEIVQSNISLIELDQGGGLESTKLSPVYETSSVTPAEGSGNSHSEYEDSFLDMSEVDMVTQETPVDDSGSLNTSLTQNSSLSQNVSLTPPWGGSSNGDMVLFSLPALEDKMMLFIIISVGVLLIVIITVISLIVCRNRSVRSGLNRKFDTFQNPIYEKPVVRVSIPSTEADPCREKLDLGDLSDSATLD